MPKKPTEEVGRHAVKAQHIAQADIQLPKKSKAFAIDTPPHLPNLAALVMFVAKRGSGKSVAMANLARMYKEHKSVQRIFYIGPTFHSNKELFEPLIEDEEDIYTEPNNASLLDMLDKINQMAEDWEEYKKRKKQYDLLMRKIARTGLNDVDDEELLKFFVGNEFKPPEWEYKGRDGKPIRPHSLLICDDCLGTDLFKPSSKLMRTAIAHRHQGQLDEGGALGLSMFIALQNYKTHNGLSRAIRTNTTQLAIWRTKESEYSRIREELSEIPENVFNHAIQLIEEGDRHDFLFIDLHPKDHFPSKLRKNFNEFLIIPEKIGEISGEVGA